MTVPTPFPLLDHSPRQIINRALTAANRRVLLFGQPGIGKSTLAAELGRALGDAGRPCVCIGADPGSPGFGLPGAVCLGRWDGQDWDLIDLEALCSLDAARFRLPLTSAVRRLAGRTGEELLLLDAPGVVRGVAGAELLTGLVEAAGIDLILVLARDTSRPPLPNEIQALGIQVFVLPAAMEAHRPSKRQRARRRTGLWQSYLHNAKEHLVELDQIQLTGTAPPLDVPPAWTGRQIAMLDQNDVPTLGEALGLDGGMLQVRMPKPPGDANSLLVRDAQRDNSGLLTTAHPFGTAAVHYVPPPDLMPPTVPGDSSGPRPVVHAGSVIATLVNGAFGDPLLHLRLQHQKRSLLFDLGQTGRLPARIAHQVTDVFISHTHIDHIGGFLWLLRSRIGELPLCRLFGPPGLAGNIEGLIAGIHWDRIGERGPRFEVMELHNDRLIRFHLQAGRAGREALCERPVEDGVLLEEATFQVRAVTLDHGTPVLAFAFEPAQQSNVRKERLDTRGLAPGPWLNELKQHIAAGEPEALIGLPDGTVQPAGALADELLLITSGRKLVYATDLADTADNRQQLTALAQGAHTFFCEAAFVKANADQAAYTGHLTARACGEIATAADVERLVPFHFSRRYEKEPERVYDEIREVCSRLVAPKFM